jgi:hypothetical protein
MTAPTFFGMAEFLIDRYPAWREEIEAEYTYWCDANIQPYPQTFLENYLLQEILASTSESATERAAYAFAVLEEILLAEDDDVVNAGLLSIVDPLATTPALFASAAPYMTPAVARWAATFLDHEQPLG